MSKNYTKQQILEAVKNSGGVMSTIAAKLKCDWHTADKYVQKHEATRQALIDEEEKVLDVCQQALIRSIKGGNTQDAKWYLATKGKKRGFSEKVINEHTGANGGAIESNSTVTVTIKKDEY